MHFKRVVLVAIVVTLVNCLTPATITAQQHGVRVVKDEAARRVDILVDGQPFTSYQWSDKLKVPTLFPLRTAEGTIVTRGFPLEPRTGERVDHPHHIGLWFNYGNVNESTSGTIQSNCQPNNKKRWARLFTAASSTRQTEKIGAELTVEMDWLMRMGSQSCERRRPLFFIADQPCVRWIELRN